MIDLKVMRFYKIISLCTLYLLYCFAFWYCHYIFKLSHSREGWKAYLKKQKTTNNSYLLRLKFKVWMIIKISKRVLIDR